MIDENLFEERMSELRNRLKSMEWDMKQGTFSKDKISYYKELQEEYKNLKIQFKSGK